MTQQGVGVGGADGGLLLVIMLAVIGLCIVVVVGAVLVSRTMGRARVRPTGSGAGSEGVERPNWEAQRSMVRERVERYRDELLRYQLGLERHRRNAPRDALSRLLRGHEQVTSRPMLYLNSEEWKWDQQRLQDAVSRTLVELGLQVPAGVREPTSQAERACDEWAFAEAKRQFDRILGSDAKA